MPWTALDEQSRLAAYERIARFTVGIAANNNLNIGTGVLVRQNENRCILTAAHVIRDCAPESLRFWLRPPAPMKEKAARDALDWEIGLTTEGTCLPVTLEGLDERLDIGVLRLDPAFELPDGPDFYNLVHSREFTPWPDAKLEGTSLYLFGFPTENSGLFLRAQSVRMAFPPEYRFRFQGLSDRVWQLPRQDRAAWVQRMRCLGDGRDSRAKSLEARPNAPSSLW
jgi:hypothetical protein